MPTCRAGDGASGRQPGGCGPGRDTGHGRGHGPCRSLCRSVFGSVLGRVSGALMAALIGGGCAGATIAADAPLSPTPPEPAASAEQQDASTDVSALGSYLVGRYAHARGDYAAAAEHLQRVLHQDPGKPALLRRAVSLLVADGQVEDAAALARRLVEIDDRARLARLVLGLQDAIDDDFESALLRIGAIPGEGVYSFVLPLAEGWLHAGAGSGEAALDALAPLAERDPYRPFFLFHAGLMHDLSGEQAEAEAFLREAVALSRGSHRPVAALGSLLARAGRIDEARAVYERFRTQSPENAWVERVLAKAEAEAEADTPPLFVADAREGLAEAMLGAAAAMPQREIGDAGLIYARLALFLRDDLDAARFVIGEILEGVELFGAAVAAYRSIPPGSDYGWAARLRAAAGLAELDRTDEAVAALSAMAEERPERTDAASALGDALRISERYAEAASAYDTAIGRIAAVGDRHWRLFYLRGIAFERIGAWPRAEADFLRALELQPDQPLVLNYLGYSWIEQGRNLDTAKTMIEKAVELRPDDGYIVDSLGWAAYRLGDYEEAVYQLERAVELQAGDPVINDHLGDAYWQVGRLNEARFQWRRVLTLEPDDELAGQVRRKLVDGLSAGAEAEDEQ